MALVATAGAPGKGAIGASTPISRAGYGNYNKAKDVLKNVFAKTGNDANSVMQRTKAYVDSQKPQTQTYYGSGGGGGDYSIAYEQPDYSGWFNSLMDISNQKYEALRQAIAQSLQKAENDIDWDYAYNRKKAGKLYSDLRNGQGLSAQTMLMANRDRRKEEARNTASDNMLKAVSGRYEDLAGLTSPLSNMDSNTVGTISSWLKRLNTSA